MKFKVGDKVKLKNRRGEGWNINGEMDKYIGKTVTVATIYHHEKLFKIDDNYGWIFDFDDIEYVVKQKHFKSLPNNYTGTLEVKNGYILEKEILDETEKKYLKEVIRPFKDKVKCIRKLMSLIKGKEYISIRMEGEAPVDLPYFEKNTMYEGMEASKNYTLKELGLDE